MPDDDESRSAVRQHRHRHFSCEGAALLIRAVLRSRHRPTRNDVLQIGKRRRHDDTHGRGNSAADGVQIVVDPLRREIHLPVGNEVAIGHFAWKYEADWPSPLSPPAPPPPPSHASLPSPSTPPPPPPP